MHGAGNDFVLLDCRERAFTGDHALLSSRNFGIGCDQIVEVHNGAESGHYILRFYNQDGSEAGACGNGTRCGAAWLMQETGLEALNFTIANRQVMAWQDKGDIWVNMGSADFTAANIPAPEISLPQALMLQDTPITEAMACSMGNPHLVLVGAEEFSDEFVRTQGARLEVHEMFPEQTNVGFLHVSQDCLTLRVWERGVGETLACGSGACAAFAIARKTGICLKNTIKIHLSGGVLTIKAQGADMVMTGPVAFVAEGVWHG